MTALVPLLLLGLAGILAGGALSLYRQKASPISIAVTGLLAALAAAGGILWLIPE
ncbi:hypothetical protein [Catenuloplanes atrovinosus]|uniref:Uncharacterized protein n=1 Tax=Catenuloplanes atrovinosus TaxID=137266 RepID=A0AAE3YTL3_9ACTN|nr:hypothetical protein [Catenuloplanes atrovinosus]MDR7278139.1 hypothetical protein [Catenuloplanes atrovinosus]